MLALATWPLLGLSVAMLSRAWYLQMARAAHPNATWAVRSRRVLVASTALAIVLWGLRFAGLLGGSPL